MELAGKNLLAGLLPENDRLPVWCVPIQPDLTVKLNISWFKIFEKFINQNSVAFAS
jgi:hypothetical protein